MRAASSGLPGRQDASPCSRYLNDRFDPLDDPATGTKVSIGVASGADKVYVTKDPTVAEDDRMLPLAMRRDLMSGTFEWQGNYLVNPWADDG